MPRTSPRSPTSPEASRRGVTDGAAAFAALERAVLTFGTPSGRWVRKVHRAEIAQLVEHATENRGVASSILALGTNTGVRSIVERKWLSW